jgi:hypothetical protein
MSLADFASAVERAQFSELPKAARRPRREKMFGQGRCIPIDREASRAAAPERNNDSRAPS